MSIFTEIEGLSGENLSSALLRYLVFNCAEFRDRFVLLLSNHSPIGPIDYSSSFSCQAEFPTNSKLGNGRLDLLIKLDRLAIGIENKFFAPFQDNQPDKYMHTLDLVKESIASVNGGYAERLIYVLCPNSRKNDAQKRINKIENSAVITWEEVLEYCTKINEVGNQIHNAILKEFIDYLKNQFSFVPEFERKFAHLHKSFVPKGMSVQIELLDKLWHIFPNPGRKGAGQNWVGYSFFADATIPERGWYGFISTSEIKDVLAGREGNGSELVISTTCSDLPTTKALLPIELNRRYFLGGQVDVCNYIVNFDISWESYEPWIEAIRPFWKILEEHEIE